MLTLVLASSSAVFAAPPVFYTWNTNDGNWNVASNWNPNTVPPSNPATVVQFTGGSTFTSTNNLSGGFNLNALVIDSGYTGYDSTLASSSSSQTLVFAKNDLYTGAIQMDGSGSFNINHNIRIGTSGETFTIHGNDGQLWIGNNSAPGFANGPGNVNLNGGNLTIDGVGGPSSYVAIGSPGGTGGVISNGGLNPGSVTIATAGNGLSVYLFGTNTYTGGTNLTQGNLVVGNNTALGSGNLTVSGSEPKSLRAFDDGPRTLSNAVNLNSNITLGGGTVSTATLTLTGPVQLGGPNAQVEIKTLTSNTAISGDVSGTAGLIKNGAAMLTLSGNNSYLGATTVEAGILKAGSSTAFINGTSGAAYTVNGGTLDLNDFNLTMASLSGSGGTVDLGSADLTIHQTASTVYAGKITGSITGGINGNAGLTKSGSGSLSLTGESDYTGGTILSQGKLLIGNENALGTGTVTLAGGTTFGVTSGSQLFLYNDVTINGDINMEVGSGDFLELVGNMNLGAATRKITFTQNGSDVCFMGIVSGLGGLTLKASPGIEAMVMYCGESNTYSGLTTVEDGVRVQITKDLDAVAIPGDLQIDEGGYMEVFGLGSTTTPIAATSDVTLNGDLVFFSNYIEQQTLASLNGSGTLTNGQDGLPYESLALTILEGNFSGTLQEDPAGGALSLIKSGSGTLTLSGTNTYTGGTTLAAGKLVAGNSSAFGTGTVSVTGVGTTIGYATGINVANELNLQANVSLETLTGSSEQSGVISELGGSFGVTKTGAGTLILSGSNTYTGATDLTAGKLVAGNSNAFGTGTVTVSGTGTTMGYGDGVVLGNNVSAAHDVSLEVTTGSAEQAGNIVESSGPVSITKIGTGALTLSGGNTYKGGTNLNAGTLLVTGDTSLGGATGGVLTLSNGTTFGVVDHANADLSQAVTIGGNISIQTNDTNYLEFTGDVDLGASVRELTLLGDGGQVAFSGVIGGTGGLTLKAGEDVYYGVQVAMGGTEANTYTGLTTVGEGVQLFLSKNVYDYPAAVAIKGDLTIKNGGTVLALEAGQIASDSDVTIEAGGYLGFAMSVDGTVQTLGSLSGGGTLEPFAANMTLQVGSGTFDGVLQNSDCGCGVLTLEKYGTGTLILGGANTYTGTTSIRGGILEVASGGSISHGSTNLVAGYLSGDSGTVKIDAGATVSNYFGYLGYTAGSQGSAIVSGTWNNNNFLRIGFNGQGSLTIENGGLVNALNANLGYSATGSGTLTLNGVAGNRGVLAVQKVVEGSGSGTIIFNGGVLRATVNSTDFISGFESGDVTLGANGGFIDSNGFNLTTNIALSGSGKLTKQGLGTLILKGVNSYTNGTDVENGTLQLNSGSSITHTEANVTVGLASGDNGTLKIGTGATISNYFGYLGYTAGSQGSAIVSGTWNNNNFLRIGFNGQGSLTVENGGLVNALNANLGYYATGSGTLTLNGTPGSRGVLAVQKVVEGSGSGTIVFNGGVLRATANNTDFISGFESGDVTIGTNGGFIDSNGFNLTANVALSGSGKLTKQGLGTLILKGVNSYTNGTDVENGTLQLNSGGSITHTGANVIVGTTSGTNGTLKISAGATVSDFSGYLGNLAGSQGSASVSGTWNNTQYLRVGYNGAGSLSIQNGGIVNALNANLGSFATGLGTLTLNGVSGNRGVLATQKVVEGSGSGTIAFNGGVLRATTNSTDFISGFESGDVTLGANGGFIDSNGFNITVSSSLTGTGRLTKQGSGTLALTATNNHSGGTTIESGTLQIGSGGSTGSITGNVVNNGTLSFKHSDQVSFTGNISGSGTVAQNGTGTLSLSGANSYAGGTVINSGTLLVASSAALGSGSVSLNSGTLATNGVVNRINVGDDLIWNTGAKIALTVTADVTSERVVVLGGLTMVGSGQLTFSLTPSGLPPGHTNFLVMSVAEGFGSLTAGNFAYTTGTSGFVGTFRIDGNDLWFDDDFIPFLTQNSLDSPPDMTVVPEPSTWALLGLGLSLIAWRGYRRRKV